MELRQELESKSDHDLLIVTVTKLLAVEEKLNSYLAQQKSKELIYLTVMLGSAISAVFSITVALILSGVGQ
jgi:hypothetical protein